MANKNKKGLNTNSNSYTLIYSIVLVVLVAFILAFVFQALKPMQDSNVALDKKKQILNSLNIRDLSDADADAMYKKVVVADKVYSKDGKEIAKGTAGGENDGFKMGNSDFKAGKLALFVCNVNGKTKYVIPVYGMGLWGPISGYVSLNADKPTVYGAYFNHESETAGLGAEIKDSRDWQDKFQNKRVLTKDGNSIALSVTKNASDTSCQVDAVTGATLTSDGVNNMLHECLGEYLKILVYHESDN